jgi:CheY-like chemotaxis protein
MRTVIRRALSARGYTVDVASTLAEARELGLAGYAAVLVDAHLGPDQGIDLIMALEADNPAAASRCLLMSGGSAGAIPAGIAYLAKPFQLSELISAVQALHGPDAGPGPDRHADSDPPPALHPAASVRAGGAQRAGGGVQLWRLLELTRLLRRRERLELADFLHDGPIQELTAGGLELQMMARSPVPDARERIEFVQQRLDAAARSLRWIVDAQWLFQAAEPRLAAALEQRTAWLLTGLDIVDASGQPEVLSAVEVPAVVDIVELMLLGLAPASPPVRAQVTVRAQGQLIEVDLALTPTAADGQLMGGAATAEAAAARAALDNLASILHGSAGAVLSEQHWRGRITLPRPPRPAGDTENIKPGTR